MHWQEFTVGLQFIFRSKHCFQRNQWVFCSTTYVSANSLTHPSIQISNFIMATALKIATVQGFLSFLPQGRKPHQNSRGLDDGHFDNFPDSCLLGSFSEPNDVFSPAPNCLLQVDGTVQTNANKAECLKSKGRLHHFTWCATPQNSQWYLWWECWYENNSVLENLASHVHLRSWYHYNYTGKLIPKLCQMFQFSIQQKLV